MLRLMISEPAQALATDAIREKLAGQPYELIVFPESADRTPEVDIVLLSRDVTSSSSKTQLSPSMQVFHDVVRKSKSLAWVHTHTAGADRPIYSELRARGVQVSTSSGANSVAVAQTAIAGLLALAREFHKALRNQAAAQWRPPSVAAFPPDIEGQRAVVVGLGPIGRHIAMLLGAFGLRVTGVRHSAIDDPHCERCVQYDALDTVIGDADWVIMACPLTERTHQILNAGRLARMKPQAKVVNISRGEVIDETALTDALRSGQIAGAYLDVFEQEPLDPKSALWTLENVIVTPHLASHSSGNYARVIDIFIDNLTRWRNGERLRNAAA